MPPRLWTSMLEGENELYEAIYRDLIHNKDTNAFLTLQDKSKQRVCHTMESLLKHQVYCSFFTPNLFWHRQARTKEHMLWLLVIILDFDFGKNGSQQQYNDGGEIACLVQQKTGFIPRYVWETKTKGNYQAAILINPMTGTPKSIYLYEKMAKALAKQTGADELAVNANNLYRIPKGKAWCVPGGEIYDIDDLKKWYNENVQETKASFQTYSLYEHQIWKHTAIQKLLSGNIREWRNNAAFTIALLYKAMGKEKEEAKDFLTKWMDLVNGPEWHHLFKFSEVESSVKSAYSGKYRGPAREWIELLTGEDFPYSITGSTYKKKTIEEGGYHNANEIRTAIVSFLREHSPITIKQEELAVRINKPIRSVKRNLKTLADEGILSLKSQRGRYSQGTTMTFNEGRFGKHRTQIELSTQFDETILDIDYQKA